MTAFDPFLRCAMWNTLKAPHPSLGQLWIGSAFVLVLASHWLHVVQPYPMRRTKKLSHVNAKSAAEDLTTAHQRIKIFVFVLTVICQVLKLLLVAHISFD